MIASRYLVLIAALLLPGAALADVYGYVDEHGVAHLSDTRLDERYFLFRKQVQPAIDPPEVSGTTEELRSTVVAVPIPFPNTSGPYAEMIGKAAREHDLDPALIHAIVKVESNFDPRALSPKGASGLMQLMPATAKRYGVADIWNPLENLRGGARYLRHLLGLFKENVSLALAAYNAGEGAVIGAGHKIPPYAETRSYVPRVLQLWEQHRTRM